MKKMKTIECIEMQDRAALRIYEALKGKSQAEEMAYWRKREEESCVAYLCYAKITPDAPNRVRYMGLR